ncbi:MAG TPA: class I SAM-dependent RNA methyltransferase [Gemmatimonadaceae bacterium]|nr:class I SAM-dependent RNA methyltransferase [Gemmatimonadaceae bacterium]
MDIFAATAPGLESIAAGEAKALGVRGTQEQGGVSFSGDNRLLYLANLHLRTPGRVIVRLGRFHATTFYELERRAKKIPWQNFLPMNTDVDVRVTCRKSRLYHSDAVAERILSAMSDVRSDIHVVNADADPGDGEQAERDATQSLQRFVVRIVNDQCEISADSSGQLLHRRGYRQEVAKAPLRETLAAAMVLASGWRPGDPLLDPMCGSGTIPIEAALIARRIAPGLRRQFQFMRWPNFDAALWKDLVKNAESEISSSAGSVRIRGADRDAGAIAAATRNAERAGVADDIEFASQPLSASAEALGDAEEGEGWLLTNPPYGIRVSESGDLRNLYARLGSVAMKKKGWRVGILTDDPRLARQTGLPLRSRFETRNGGIPVSFLASEKPGKTTANRPDSVQ